MLYRTGNDLRNADCISLALIGMSGVGKTVLSNKLRDYFGWFNYSVDHRIGAHYLAENILSEARSTSERNSISNLLQSESLRPLSNFLGKPGNRSKGGIPFSDYLRRQQLHCEAEIKALLDAPAFYDAQLGLREYGFKKFVCDTGGSICEVVDANDADDPVLSAISSRMLIVYLRASDKHEESLKKRFDTDPKPMYYNETFLKDIWTNYKKINQLGDEDVDPNLFIRWGFNKLLQQRKPKYESIARFWGVTLEAEEVSKIDSEESLIDLIAAAIDAKRSEDKLRPGSIGKAFLSQREYRKISRSSLSRRLEISNAKLKKIELGKVSPNPTLEDMLFKILFSEPFARELKQSPDRPISSSSAWLSTVRRHLQ